MEQTLEVYKRAYDPRFPVVCMDEMPKQLLAHGTDPIAMRPGHSRKQDYEYVRNGTCTIWVFVEPLGGWRRTNGTERRTCVDWAQQVKALVDDPRYEQAERITLVCDNLSSHTFSALYQAFSPPEALRILKKLEMVHTPKHGSWLNIAEIELSVLSRQCTRGRIMSLREVDHAVRVWCAARNEKQVGVDWQFRTEDARVKLKRLYPLLKM